MSLKKLTSSFWAILAVAILSILNTSCSDTETTDSTNFAIYYTGMTDIGPSMTGTISRPTYKGPVPSDFAISNITINGEAYNGQCFNINPETGEISVSDTKNAVVGTYKISVSCVAGGKQYDFQDIVTVSMLKAVPDGVKVEPGKLEIKLGYITNNEEQIELPTAQVTTEGSHVSISQYAISSVLKDGVLFTDFAKLFQISQTGVISAIEGYANAEPGIYTLNLKLRTAAMDKESEDGIFENALTIDITSEPLKLTYTPSEEFIEEATAEQPETKYDTKKAPLMIGSKDGLDYSIESVTPQTDQNGASTINKFSIDKEGKIHVAAQHGFKIGEIFSVNVRVKNKYAPEGIVFANVLKLETVAFIQPVENFKYGTAGVVEQVEKSKFLIQKSDDFQGDKVSFTWLKDGLDKTVIEQLEPGFNAETGEFSIAKDNKLPLGEYKIRVQATNQKSDDTNPTIAEFTLKIGKNPNNFTTFSYGNNYAKYYTKGDIDFTNEMYDNQFRFRSGNDISELSLVKQPNFDPTIKPGYTPKVKWSVLKVRKAGAKIASGTGNLTFTWLANTDPALADAVIVTATAYDSQYSTPEDDPTSISVSLPVFVHFSRNGGTASKETDKYRTEYVPFVLKTSPKGGGKLDGKLYLYEEKNSSVAPVSWNLSTKSYAIDYARTFYYYNIGGYRTDIDNDLPDDKEPDFTAHENGAGDAKTDPNPFIMNLWKKCDEGNGSKLPVSGFTSTGEHKADFSKTLAYVNNNDNGNFAVHVPNRWFEHGYANGLFIAQMTYLVKPDESLTIKDKANIKSNGTQIFPLVIWFDEKFAQ